jgi:hypothetical protein
MTEPTPICPICRIPILEGEGRYRRGVAEFHTRCYAADERIRAGTQTRRSTGAENDPSGSVKRLDHPPEPVRTWQPMWTQTLPRDEPPGSPPSFRAALTEVAVISVIALLLVALGSWIRYGL